MVAQARGAEFRLEMGSFGMKTYEPADERSLGIANSAIYDLAVALGYDEGDGLAREQYNFACVTHGGTEVRAKLDAWL